MDRNTKLKVGLYKRIFNKNLKEAIESSEMTSKRMVQFFRDKEIKMNQAKVSRIINFRECPTEDQKIVFAIVLSIPIDDIFPEKYDELYEKIHKVEREAVVEIETLTLDSPEVLMLEARDDLEEKVDNKLAKDSIMKIIKSLSDKEQKVIIMRFGLDDGVSHTLEEVSKEFGVQRERIRQIEAKALEKIRASSDKEITELAAHGL